MYGDINNIKEGDIILCNRLGKESTFFSDCVRYFTGFPYSHSALIMTNVYGYQSVLTADEVVNCQPVSNYWNESRTDFEVYRIPKVTTKDKKDALTQCYYNYSGQLYGFTQVLWFVYRWFMEHVFKKDVRRAKNPFGSGIVCSELVWDYLDIITKDNPNLIELRNFIYQWTPDTVAAGDIAIICKSMNFELIYSNKI